MSTPAGEPEQPPSPYEPPRPDRSPGEQPVGHPSGERPAEPPPWDQPGGQPGERPTGPPPWDQATGPPPWEQPTGPPPWGPQQPTYPAAGWYGPPTGGGTNVLAILSLVCAFVFAPAGVVLGHLAKRQIRHTGEEGGQLATWGLVLGYAFTAIGLLACCGWLALVVWAGTGPGTGY
ncbi:DUF4190 domain-containing protein [Micromonospora rifamycinica]|uniref:DUF4190 domain-containing protein n=1 Tax=Micromonospora rifamycinica TaxID=291594 RepID=UPI003410CF86